MPSQARVPVSPARAAVSTDRTTFIKQRARPGPRPQSRAARAGSPALRPGHVPRPSVPRWPPLSNGGNRTGPHPYLQFSAPQTTLKTTATVCRSSGGKIQPERKRGDLRPFKPHLGSLGSYKRERRRGVARTPARSSDGSAPRCRQRCAQDAERCPRGGRSRRGAWPRADAGPHHCK